MLSEPFVPCLGPKFFMTDFLYKKNIPFESQVTRGPSDAMQNLGSRAVGC